MSLYQNTPKNLGTTLTFENSPIEPKKAQNDPWKQKKKSERKNLAKWKSLVYMSKPQKNLWDPNPAPKIVWKGPKKIKITLQKQKYQKDRKEKVLQN